MQRLGFCQVQSTHKLLYANQYCRNKVSLLLHVNTADVENRKRDCAVDLARGLVTGSGGGGLFEARSLPRGAVSSSDYTVSNDTMIGE